MKRFRIILKNDFHNTEVTLYPTTSGVLSRNQVRRSLKVLCGMDDCHCGGNLGERGRQAMPDGGHIVIHPNTNGTAAVHVIK